MRHTCVSYPLRHSCMTCHFAPQLVMQTVATSCCMLPKISACLGHFHYLTQVPTVLHRIFLSGLGFAAVARIQTFLDLPFPGLVQLTLALICLDLLFRLLGDPCVTCLPCQALQSSLLLSINNQVRCFHIYSLFTSQSSILRTPLNPIFRSRFCFLDLLWTLLNSIVRTWWSRIWHRLLDDFL